MYTYICVYTHTERCAYILYNSVCVCVYMYIDIFLCNKWVWSFCLKKGNFSMENLDKTETLLCDRHFPQDARWFLFGGMVFNQTLLPRRVVAYVAVPAPHPGDSLCLGEPQYYTPPPPYRKNLVCCCMSAGLRFPIWGNPTRMSKSVGPASGGLWGSARGLRRLSSCAHWAAR